MKEIAGDIWGFHKKGNWIVIPTNGSVRKDGCCVMGRGIAMQARDKLPGLSKRLGKKIIEGGNRVYAFPMDCLFSFPVMHFWYEKADLALIESGLPELIWYAKDVYELDTVFVPRLGCGNGRLDWEDVKPILEKYLDDRFIVVTLEKDDKRERHGMRYKSEALKK